MERRLLRSLDSSKRSLRWIALTLLSGYLVLPVIFFSMTSRPGYVSAEGVLTKIDAHDVLKFPDWFEIVEPTTLYDQILGYNVINIETVDGVTSLFTPFATVESILESAGIQFDGNDQLNVSVTDVLGTSATIKLIRIDSVEEALQFPIPFQTIFEEDPELEEGKESIKQVGIDGVKLVRYEHIFADGIKVDELIAGEEILVEPVQQIVIKGTKPKPIVLYSSNTCDHWDSVIDQKTAIANERTWLKSVMRCESMCNAAHDGYHKGLFQFLPGTFKTYGGTNIFDGEEQIGITLHIYRLGGAGQWPYCSSKVVF